MSGMHIEIKNLSDIEQNKNSTRLKNVHYHFLSIACHTYHNGIMTKDLFVSCRFQSCSGVEVQLTQYVIYLDTWRTPWL